MAQKKNTNTKPIKKTRQNSSKIQMTPDMLKAYRNTIDKAFAKIERSGLAVNPIGKSGSMTYQQYTKENFRAYMKNIKSNENNLVLMSRFLSKVCTPYNRILWYYATIPLFYWNLSPILNLSEDNIGNSEKIISDYHTVLTYVNNLHLDKEARTIIYAAERDGVYYGVVNESDNNTFFQMLEPQYCQPIVLNQGVWDFAFDFSFFDKKENFPYLENWDPMFTEGYRLYQNDTKTYRWQILDPEKTICIKADNANYKENIPMFIGMFESLLDLLDAKTLQRNRDIIQNYKMILYKIPLVTDKNSIDEFSLEIETAMKFYNMLLNNLPEGVGAALTPMDMDTIDFKPDDNTNDLISTSMKTVFDDSGVSEMLFNSNKSGSIGLDASIKTDVALSWQFVESLEAWVRRYISFKDSKNQYSFEILRSNIFNEDKVIKSELSLANSGIPNKLRLAASSGINPLETLSSLIFENDILELADKFIPLKTSFTMTGDDFGDTSEKAEEDLTEEGQNTKDKQKNKTEV